MLIIVTDAPWIVYRFLWTFVPEYAILETYSKSTGQKCGNEAKMARNMFELSPEEKKKMLDEIVYFFREERDEDLGIIGSETILDFFLDVLGDTIYNRALDDVRIWLKRNIENLESDYYALYK